MKLIKATAMRISNLLMKHKMSRYALCKKIAMPQQTLKNIIDEVNGDIQISTIAKIADGFEMSLEEFFDDPLFNRDSVIIE